ncbi:leucine-rich repeat-containing protein 56-like [Symsagittifera roscoffensis]|uniref:leucine-rich repeat-containing protein 56-like n=1 Tax=Symsagittifera roscoffensis TaxID=84072 RepID=UPI00307CB156
MSNFTVQVSNFQDQDKINPRPNEKTESEYLLEEFLSPWRLKEITGESNLEDASSLQMVVDTTENSLGNFGHYLPNLTQLDLSNSVLTSIRDLGSSLAKLEVLWLTKCQLVDLDGIPTFANLTELYLSYNHINNISDLSMMENLRTLDLEANDIDDIDQIIFLEVCGNLLNLCLQHNPICSTPKPMLPFDPDYNYRSAVIKMLPQLKNLDDIPVSDKTQDFTNLDEDLQLLTENIKFGLISEGEDSDRPGSSTGKRPGSALSKRPGTAMRPRSAMPSMLFGKSSFGVRPGTAARFDRPPTAAEKAFFQLPTARPGTGSSVASTDSAIDMDEFSKLTSGNIVCGNPLKAIRNKKSEKQINKTRNLELSGANSNANTKLLASDETFSNILEELKEWRQEFDQKKDLTKLSMTEEVNVLTLSADEAIDVSAMDENSRGVNENGRGDKVNAIKDGPSSQNSLSPEHHKRSSVNIRRRQYAPVSENPRNDSSYEFVGDESYEDGDSGLASSRETDTPASFLNEYQQRGPFRSSDPKLNPSVNLSKLAPHQMSIKPSLVPVALKPSLSNIGSGSSPVRPKIKNASRPARSTIDQMGKNKPSLVPAPPTAPPHKLALSARPKSAMTSLSFEKFSGSS